MDPWHPKIEWALRTADDRVIHVHRAEDQWVVQSGSILAKSRSLDVALIEVFRSDADVESHGRLVDHAAWIREQAASIEGPDPPGTEERRVS